MKSKLTLRFYFLVLLIPLSIFFSCSKKSDPNQDPTTKVPVMTTESIINITKNSAQFTGIMNSNGDLTTRVRGFCLSKKPTPTISDTIVNDTAVNINNTNKMNYQCNISNLRYNTKYYIRAYATCSNGTGYGKVLSFTTQNYTILFNPNLTYGSVTDVDGNKYKTIQIGLQTWTAENLKVTHYRDGSPIPNVTDGNAWNQLSTGAFCDYENLPVNSEIYGKLYNWYTMKDPRNLAPLGWHVATYDDWQTLLKQVGQYYVAGGKLKETGTENWSSPNVGATNESGFTALPSATRQIGSWIPPQGEYTFFWCDYDYQHAPQFVGIYSKDNIAHVMASYAINGFSIRCVKD